MITFMISIFIGKLLTYWKVIMCYLYMQYFSLILLLWKSAFAFWYPIRLGCISTPVFTYVLMKFWIIILIFPKFFFIDGNRNDFPQPFSTALFSFLYHLASYESGNTLYSPHPISVMSTSIFSISLDTPLDFWSI